MTVFVPRRATDIAVDALTAIGGMDAQVTDLNPGSVVRTLFEAFALVEEELDHRVYEGILAAIAEELYTAFDFAALPAVPASGTVQFVRASTFLLDVVIPEGTTVAAPPTALKPERRYVTTDPATLQAGENAIDVPVIAQLTGSISNAAAGAISLLRSTVPGLGSVSNLVAFHSGLDAETDYARRVRFAKWVENLRGSQTEGLEANAERVVLYDEGGQAIERVDQALAVDSYVAGRVDVYLDNGGGDASAALKATVRALLEGGREQNGSRRLGYKAGGIVVRVFGTTGVPVDVTGTLVLEAGFTAATVVPAVKEAITDYLYGLRFHAMILADLTAVIVGVEGVYDVVLTTPTANRTAEFAERLLPGTLLFATRPA
jgi:uncharacterized phage protein gp47/JayE